MRENFLIERVNPKSQKDAQYFGFLVIVVYALLIAVFISGCAKDQDKMKTESGLTAPLSTAIAGTFPENNADTVVINPIIEVTFKSSQDTSVLTSSTLILKQGTIPVAGTVGYSKTSIQFIPLADLKPETEYTASIKKIKGKSSDDKEEHSWTFKTGKHRDKNSKLAVVSVNPLNGATDIATDVHPLLTFDKALSGSITKTLSIKLQAGTTTVSGTVSYSGMNATFTPATALLANTLYTGTVSVVNKDDDDDDDHEENEENEENEDNDEYKSMIIFTWSFTTNSGGIDDTAPTVLSVLPANNASSVAVNVQPTATFSEAMNAGSINATTFTLKKGTTSVPGTVTYSGTTATFTPSANLEAGTVYTGTISTGAKDVAGNAMENDFTWNFTIAAITDATSPTVLSVAPANGTTSVPANSNVSATFSEAMNSSTINSTTFTLKQGSTSVPGSVTYSGTTATFNPSNELAGGMVYTATITTGAKDVAGNTITSSKIWSFTTVASAPAVTFANDVMPILQSRCTPCHGATSPSAGISITNYTTVSKLSNSQLDNSSMYPKLGTTTAEQSIIKAWIAAGRLNN